jgi:small subunit ribosomal protein S20
MPVIKSAKKKLKQDRKREQLNSKIKNAYRSAIKDAQKNKSFENVRLATKLIDKASKKGIIHKNKAARIKSKLSKIAKPTVKKNSTAKITKKSSKTKK